MCQRIYFLFLYVTHSTKKHYKLTTTKSHTDTYNGSNESNIREPNESGLDRGMKSTYNNDALSEVGLFGACIC